MRSVILLYNPHAGRHPEQRLRLIEQVAAALRARDLQVTTVPTTSPGSAGQQAAERDADIIFACGGDGTVHEVLQGMAFHPRAALGILPVGTANVLARDLKLPVDPLAAALAQIDCPPRTLPLGSLQYTAHEGARQRYFLVMAGAGPDGELVRESMRALKLRTGPLSYYLRSARIYFTAHFPHARVSMQSLSGAVLERRAQGIMAFRVGSMGGAFGPRTPRGAADHPHLQVTLLKPPLRLAMLAWLASGWVQLPGISRLTESFQVESLDVAAGGSGVMQVQADGEWLGTTPMTMNVVPGALRMLLPALSR